MLLREPVAEHYGTLTLTAEATNIDPIALGRRHKRTSRM